MATNPALNPDQVNPNIDLEIDLEMTSHGLVSVAPTPLQLLQLAITRNADLDRLSKLMDLYERWEKRQAKSAFDAAMNAFKAESPRVLKNKHVHFEAKSGGAAMDYNHATLDHVCDVLIAALAKHGIYHSWKFSQEKGAVTVTCILTGHGHTEERTLSGAADTSGLKNSIQADCSTVTYLERYTLLGVCGLAASNSDNDGRGAEPSDDSRVAQHCKLMLAATSVTDLQGFFRNAYGEAAQVKDKAAMARYISVKEARKKELL